MMGVALLGLGLTGCLNTEKEVAVSEEETAIEIKTEAPVEAVSKAEVVTLQAGVPVVPVAEKIDLAQYTEYSASKFEALKGKQKFMVFFYADWCGTCRAWEAKFKANLKTLPADTIVLKANFDKDKDLVKALGVKSQSTGVFFDASGAISATIIDPKMEKLIEFFQ